MLGLTQINVATWLAEKGGKLIAIGILVAAVAGTYYLTYRLGAHGCEQKHLKAQVQEARAHEQAIVKDATVRAPVVEAAATRREELNQRNKQSQEKLNAAVKATGPKPSCDLSDDELRAFHEIGS